MAAKTKKAPPQPVAPYEPTDYQQGVLDTMEMVRSVVGTLYDAEIQVRRITHDATPALLALLAGTNAAANIGSHIRSEVEKAAMRRLNERKRMSPVGCHALCAHEDCGDRRVTTKDECAECHGVVVHRLDCSKER